MEESLETTRLVVEAAEEKKAKDVTVLDVRGITLVADYFVICSGTSSVHLSALVDGIDEKLKGNERRLLRKEGSDGSGWILMDYGDVIVHVFREKEREFYDLERLWGHSRSCMC